MDRIEVNGYGMVRTSVGGWGCYRCGSSIDRGDYLADCPDCGAVFCRSCVEDGSFGSHICEEDEE